MISRITKLARRVRSTGSARPRHRAISVAIEPLERRILLSWIGATSGNSNDAAHLYNNTANWAGGVIDDSFAGVTFTADTTFFFNAGRTTTASGLNLVYNGNFNLTFESSSATLETLTLGGNISGTFGGSSVIIGDPTNNLNLDLGAAARTFTISSGNTLSVLNVVSGGVGLTEAGSGTLTLSSANTYSGGTTLSAGQLNINNAAAIGTGTFTINGGTIDNTSGAAVTLSNNNLQTWGANFTFTGSNSLNLGTGAVTLGTIITSTISGSALTVAGVIDDGGNGYLLTKAGAGTLTLSGANTFSGGTTLNAGQLNINNATALGSGTFTINGGTIDNTSGGAITLSQNNSLDWENGFTFVGSNALNLGTGGVILDNNVSVTTSASTLTVAGVIDDLGNGYVLAKAGAGALTLAGANTYSGGTTLNAGQLNINNSTALGSGTFTINGGTIDNTTGGAITLSQNNSQDWKNSFTFVGSNSLNLGTGGVILDNNVSVTASASTLTVAGAINDLGNLYALTKLGAGTLALTTANTYGGGTTIGGGVLDFANGGLGSGGIAFSATSTLQWNGGNNQDISSSLQAIAGGIIATFNTNGNNVTMASVLSGTGAIIKAGAGALALSASNNFGGGLTLSAGTLDINNATAVGSGTLTINGGTISNTSGGAITLSNNNAMVWGGNFTFTGFSGLNLGTGNVTLTANRTVNDTGTTLTVGGVISGAFSLTKSGNGTLALSGANTFSNGFTLSTGVLDFNNATATGSGTFIINAGSIDNTTGSAITLTNNNAITMSSFTFIGSTPLNFGTGAVTITGNRTITTTASTLTIGGIIGGGFRLTKSGNGTLVLAGANTFSNGLTLTTGVLDLNNASAIGTGTFIINGGSIDNTTGSAITLSHNNAITMSSFTFVGSSALNFGTGAVTITANRTVTVTASNLTIGGAIGDGGGARSITKAGNGTLTLSGTSTFSGGTVLSAGQLNINSAAAVGSGRLTLNAGTIDNTSGSSLTLSNNNLQTWGGNFTFAGSNNLNLGVGAVTLSASPNIITSAGILSVGGNISGAQSLTKAGNGTLLLSGNNNYSLGTTLSAGRLDINSATAIGTSTLTINGGSIDNTSGSALTLSSNNAQTWAGDFTFAGSNNLNMGTGAVTLSSSRIVTISASTLTDGGVIDDSGNGYAISSAGGTLVLTGASTFSGGVTVISGVLLANNASGSATGSGNITVDGGATLGGTGTLSGAVTVNSGGVLAPGSGGTAILSTGNLTLSSGANLDIVLSGNTAGSGYDQVNVTGTVSIANSILNLSGTRSAHDGTSLTIINNSSAGAVTGTFQGLAEAATTTFNGVTYTTSYVGGSSNNVTLLANLGATIIGLTSATNPSVFGQSVTFTATVTSTSSGTPTGSVTFGDGVTTLGTATLNGSGLATFSTAALSVTGHTISAIYGGDSNFSGSTPTTLSQTVNQDATTSVVASSANPSVFGQSVTFTATITANAPGAGTPTGSVTFMDGATTLGTGTLNGSGIATLSTAALSVGSHSITVVYGGDSDFTTSTSSALSQTVNKDATTTAIASSANPAVFGQSITLTATVTSNAPGAGTPTGSVNFMSGLITLGTGVLNGSGIATFSESAAFVGSFPVTAAYAGDTDFTTSTSSTLTQSINQDASTSVVASSVNASVFGQSVTFTATITANSPGAGTPSGTVTFKDGATTIGSGTLNGSGIATFATAALSVGSHSITAVYGGDGDFTGSTSSTLTQAVNQDDSTSVVTSSANPSVFGQSVTFTATVTADAPGGGIPTGTVTFEDGATILGTGNLDGSGIATFSTSALSVGIHAIRAAYGGDVNDLTSISTVMTQTVNQDASTSVVASSPNPTVFGQPVVFTATVTAGAPGTGVPTGSVLLEDGSTIIGVGTLDGSGQTTFLTIGLSVGSHSITVVYSGDTDFTTSTSSALSQTVNQDASTSVLVSTANPSVFGQSVTFTATIGSNAPGSGTPTGSVTFMDGATTLGTGTLDGSGVATFATSALSVGSHSITAVYGGDTDFTSSTSSALSQTVNQDASTSVVASSANPSVFGQSVTFTATVTANAPGAGTPTGSVTFKDGATTLGSGTLDGSGIATFTTSALSVGGHSITVVYGGDSDFTTSTSSALTQTVNQDASTSVVASAANPSVFGQSVTLTATVTANAPGSGTPTGSVTFMDGATTLGAGTLNGSGIATFATSALSVGSHSITAVYGGDTNFATSTSSALSQTVNQDDTTSAVSSSANPAVFGQSITFTATVTSNAPGSGTPTGSVIFMDGATTLGSGILNGSGIATFATSALSVGSHSITVVYGGDTDFITSTSSTLSQTVNQDASTSVVASSANPSVFGQSITFTATITANAPGVGTPTGSVTFKDGATTLGSGTLDGSGIATFTTSALSLGSHSITAVYGGDTDFTSSTSSSLSQIVNEDASISVVASSANPSVFGQSVTFTATVTANALGAGTPSGTVTFKDGATTLGSGTLDGSGIATFTTSALSVGGHSITVVYGGDSDFTTSTSSALTQTVNQDASTSVVASAANPSVFGQSVTLTATVTANAPGSGTPTGSVTFMDGATTLGTGTLNGSGIATFATSAFAVGIHSITVVFDGDTNFITSTSSMLSETVDQDTLTSLVASSANPSVFGQSVTFTATVTADTPGSGTPTGSVTFEDGSTTLGAGTLDGSGIATFTTSSLSVGAHSITAVYGGDTDFAGSTSSAVSQAVNQDASTSVVASSANPSVSGESVTFTATVTSNAPGSGTATGLVIFMDGATTLGSGTLNGAGIATFATSALLVGSHSITAIYSGDTDFITSTSSTLNQTVNQDASTSFVASSVNPSVFGQSVTFTATVTANAPGAGTPSGTVTFKDGATTLGAGILNGSGIATFATSGLSVGSHSITAVYGGDTDFTSSASSALSQTVNQDASTSAIASSANPSVFGQSVTFTATVAANTPGAGTPTGTVTFKDGAATLGTGTLNGSGIATFATSALSVGSHSITAVYGGDTDFITSTSSTLSQTVNQDASTSIIASSANPAVFGQSITFTATVTSNTPGSGIPTGLVTFMDGATTLGTGTLNGSGITTFTTSAFSVGSHSITAVYGGDTDFITSTSSMLSQTANQDASTSIIASSANPAVFGQSITFTATVTSNTPGAGTPGGLITFMDGATTLGTGTLDGSGAATFTSSALGVGSHSITAVYGGDTDFTTSTSSALTQTVNQDASTSAVASSANPSVFGQSITFTATVTANTPGAGIATGSVTFMDGATTLGTGVLNGSGIATFSTSALSVGSHSITAVFGGDSDFTTSTSTTLSQSVSADSTSAALTSSHNPSVSGQSITFTATITADAPGAGIPTGSVTFMDGATTLGTGTLNGAGVATFSTAALAVGSHSITAVYGADTDFTSSTSSTLSQTVDQDASTSVVSSSANPSVFGQSITFTATVTANTPGAGIPSGSVTFMDGSTTLGAGTLDSSGVATFSTSALGVGSHSITVVYSGDSDFTAGASSSLTQIVNRDATNSAVTSSANPSVFGQSITFTATVTANTPGSGIPTGSVTFMDGLATLGTGVLDGSGHATFTTSALLVGSHSITAVFGGDTDFAGSTSSTLNQTVNRDASTSTVVSSANSSVFGQSITFTATVTSNLPGAGTPAGSVTFKDGSTILGTSTLNGSGIATFTTSALSIGAHPITAIYGGNTDFTTSTSSPLTQTVNTDTTSAAVTSSHNPSVFGQSVTFTATVTADAPGSGIPTGSVTFMDGSTILGVTAINGSGIAVFTTSALAVGAHSVTAVFGGSTDFTTSTSSTLSQAVNADAASAVVTISHNPSVFGQSVTFTATITANAPGSGIPTGSVTFMDGATTLGTGTLNGSGIATFTTSALSISAHSITAVYGGATNFTTSTSSASIQTVNEDATSIAVTSSRNPSVLNRSVTFTATVAASAPGSGIPTGTITFKDGSTVLAVRTLNGSCIARFTTSALASGAHSITAEYSGDSDFTAGTSPAILQTVDPVAATRIAVAHQPQTITAGQMNGVLVANITSTSGVIDTGFNSTVAISIMTGPTGGKLAGTLVATAVNGVATFSNLQLTQTGTYVLGMSTQGGIAGQSGPITINPGPAAHVRISTQPAASWQFGHISPNIVVAITDQYGNLVTGDHDTSTATIASGPLGAILSGTRTVPIINGYATFSDLFVNLPGVYSLAITSDNNSPAVITDLQIVAIPTRRYLFNGSPLSQTSILMLQLRSAPKITSLGPPIIFNLTDAVYVAESANFAAAPVTPGAIATPLFVAEGSAENSSNPDLKDISKTLQKFLESR